jgi:hypothetical protein
VEVLLDGAAAELPLRSELPVGLAGLACVALGEELLGAVAVEPLGATDVFD